MKPILYSILISLLVPIGFWIGGFDFERGQAAAWCYGTTIYIAGAVWFLFFKERE